METKEQNRRRIMGKQFLCKYLDSLNCILNRKIDPKELLSIVATDNFYHEIDYQIKPQLIKTIKFSERNMLKEYLQENGIKLMENFILWVEYTNDCGAIMINLLDDFNFNFPFNSTKGEIISLTEISYKYQIVLDFYEEKGIEYMEIQLYYNIQKLFCNNSSLEK